MVIMSDGAAGTGAGGSVGVWREYLCPARDQLFLMAPCMSEWLPAGHLARFVIARVEEMNTAALHVRPGGAPGRRPYLPEMMLALVLYAYCLGIRSSRVIEALCVTDAAFRVICGGLSPDHTTIARFVAVHEGALEGLFCEGVRLCAQAGLVDLSVVALDGTKIAADASLARNRDEDWLRREIARLMALTAQDARESAGAQTLGGVSAQSDPAAGVVKLQAALAVIDAEIAAAAAEAERAAAAAAEEAGHGRRLRGRKPKDAGAALARARADARAASERLAEVNAARAERQAAKERGERLPPAPSARLSRANAAVEQTHAVLEAAERAVQSDPGARRANVTDPDSRIMSTKDRWVQAYNAQAIVDAHQIVVACEVTQDHNDQGQYEPMTRKLADTLTAAGITATPQLVLADAGYCSEHNLTIPGPDRLIATANQHTQRATLRELGPADGPPPPGLTATQEMAHLLRTPQGAAAYKQRSQLIEAVFGDRKENRHARRFRRRGLTAVNSEWKLINLAGNLQKLYRHTSLPATT